MVYGALKGEAYYFYCSWRLNNFSAKWIQFEIAFLRKFQPDFSIVMPELNSSSVLDINSASNSTTVTSFNLNLEGEEEESDAYSTKKLNQATISYLKSILQFQKLFRLQQLQHSCQTPSIIDEEDLHVENAYFTNSIDQNTSLTVDLWKHDEGSSCTRVEDATGLELAAKTKANRPPPAPPNLNAHAGGKRTPAMEEHLATAMLGGEDGARDSVSGDGDRRLSGGRLTPHRQVLPFRW
ncbi:hypothetical protein PIB30_002057 [Stylosanthes scabra]|uniref:Uncharacterized protein n=1 Tax=Stylosanthes scabra TaxID=79078 RepID=A0ABU6Q3X6_9FABA|nr:hypothetical protein [Stylosanthes scabra]